MNGRYNRSGIFAVVSALLVVWALLGSVAAEGNPHGILVRKRSATSVTPQPHHQVASAGRLHARIRVAHALLLPHMAQHAEVDVVPPRSLPVTVHVHVSSRHAFNVRGRTSNEGRWTVRIGVPLSGSTSRARTFTVWATTRRTATNVASFRVLATLPPAVAIGAYIVGPNGQVPSDRAVMQQYIQQVGRRPAIVMWYQSWAEQFNRWSTASVQTVARWGAMPMITWEPGANGATDSRYRLEAIVRGDFDSYIRSWALAARAWRHPFFLRFAQEMNGDWYPWGTKIGNPQGNTSEQFRAAWRHVHDIFQHVGASNAIWVWSPNTMYPGSTPYADDYPGNTYVDWIGIDGYNAGPPSQRWLTFRALFAQSYETAAALTKKPMMIAETASSQAGGDKAAWIRNAFLSDIPLHFPRIRALVWFDKRKERDWRVDSSSAVLAAWRMVTSSPLYDRRYSIDTLHPRPLPAPIFAPPKVRPRDR